MENKADPVIMDDMEDIDALAERLIEKPKMGKGMTRSPAQKAQAQKLADANHKKCEEKKKAQSIDALKITEVKPEKKKKPKQIIVIQSESDSDDDDAPRIVIRHKRKPAKQLPAPDKYLEEEEYDSPAEAPAPIFEPKPAFRLLRR